MSKKIIFLFFVSTFGVRLEKRAATEFLKRSRRANEFWDELCEGNMEKECIEESCDAEELGESLDMYSQDVYKRYKDIFTACKSLTAEILTIFNDLPQVTNGEKQFLSDEKVLLRDCVFSECRQDLFAFTKTCIDTEKTENCFERFEKSYSRNKCILLENENEPLTTESVPLTETTEIYTATSTVTTAVLVGFSSGGSDLEGTMAKKIEGKWSIDRSDNSVEYFKAIGVNTLVANIVAKLSADIEIRLNDKEVTQVSTTRGAIKKVVTQKFPFEGKSTFKNPLTGEEELSVLENDEDGFVLKIEQTGSDIVETATYILKEGGKKLQQVRKVLKSGVTATWYFSRPE